MSLPLRLLGEVIFLSWFVNHLIPAKMGDLYRGLVLRRREQISFSMTTGSVLAERVIDMSAILIVAITAAFFFVRGELLTEMRGVLLSAGILVVLIAGGLFLFWRLDSNLLSWLPHRLGERFERFQRGIFTSMQPLWLMIMLTVLVWAAEAGRFFLVANAMGVPLTMPQLLFVFAAGALLLAAPTPGGLGAVEGGMVGVMLLARRAGGHGGGGGHRRPPHQLLAGAHSRSSLLLYACPLATIGRARIYDHFSSDLVRSKGIEIETY